MKDFKNEKEYGNIKTEKETYEGIILEKNDEEYRYYSSSSSNSSTSSTINNSSGGSVSGSGSGSGGGSGSNSGSGLGTVIIDRAEISKGSSGYTLTMHASCQNAWNMCLYVDSVDTSVQVFSKGVSASEIGGECNALSGNKTYRITAIAIPYSGTSKVASVDVPIYEPIADFINIHPTVKGVDLTNNVYSVSISINCNNATKMVLNFSGDSSFGATVNSDIFGAQYTLHGNNHCIDVVAYGYTSAGKQTTTTRRYELKLTEDCVPTTLFVEVLEDLTDERRKVKITGDNTISSPTTISLKCENTKYGTTHSWASSNHEISATIDLADETYTFTTTSENHDTHEKFYVTQTVKIGKKVGNGKKVLLLYVGPGYAEYTDNDVKKLLKRSGATDFLITMPYKFNYYSKNSSEQIISVADVNSLSTSIFGSNASTEDKKLEEYEKIRNDTIVEINNIDICYPNAKPCYWDYIESATALANKIIRNESADTNQNVGIWFAIPMMLGSGIAADLYIDVYKQCIDDICANCDVSRITGFYYAQEEITPWYTRFDENAFIPTQNNSSSQISGNSSATVQNYPFNNVIVRNMMEISEYIHGSHLNKKFMWIPYYGSNSETSLRLGNVANKTSIFDYIIIQPSYFCDANGVTYKNLTTVRNCVDNQLCVDHNENAIGTSSKLGSSLIGAEMEIDLANTNHYHEYVENFKQLLYDDRPIGFYANDRDTTMAHSIFSKIETFFRFGY